MPSRDEIHKLTQRVEDLTSKLDALQKKGAKAPVRKATPAKKTSAKAAVRKTA